MEGRISPIRTRVQAPLSIRIAPGFFPGDDHRNFSIGIEGLGDEERLQIVCCEAEQTRSMIYEIGSTLKWEKSVRACSILDYSQSSGGDLNKSIRRMLENVAVKD